MPQLFEESQMNFLTPYMTWIKIGLALALVAGACWLTWDYAAARHDRAIQELTKKKDAERAEAVREAYAISQKAIDTQRQLTAEANKRAEEIEQKTLQSIAKQTVVTTQVKTVIVKEIERNPEAYSTPLPEEGYKQWLAARALMEDSPQ